MTASAELLRLLDGPTIDNLGPGLELHLAPDSVLEAARSALSTGTGLESALEDVEDQIARASLAFRGIRYGMVEKSVQHTSRPDADLLRQMLNELHLAAFRIQRQRGAIAEARDHLIRAAAIEADKESSRLYFVELYVELGEYAAAVTSLDNAVGEAEEGAFHLLELGIDLATQGAFRGAYLAFDRSEACDSVGLISEICRVRRSLIQSGKTEQSSSEEVQSRFTFAGGALEEGLEYDAFEGFLFVLAHEPRAARAWFGAGCALRNQVERELDWSSEGGARVVQLFVDRADVDKGLDDRAYSRIARAREAFRYAIALERTLWPAADALTWVELWLDRWDRAFSVVAKALSDHPGNPILLATLSVVLLARGQFSEAQEVAARALEAQPDNEVAEAASLFALAATQSSDETGP
jgi:tetratricopeptide (TPR) repeat protein